jgi:hypothetical protein
MIKSHLEGDDAEAPQVAEDAEVAAEVEGEAEEGLGVPLGVSDPVDADLALVVSAWPTLSEPLRAAVLALVSSSIRPR